MSITVPLLSQVAIKKKKKEKWLKVYFIFIFIGNLSLPPRNLLPHGRF